MNRCARFLRPLVNSRVGSARSLSGSGSVMGTILPEKYHKFEWNHYNSGIEAAFTPSSTWYTDPDFLTQVEAKVTFPRNWLLVGRTDQIPNDGDYIAGNVMSKHPWVVVRNDKKINGFYNVCRHHAAQIVDDGAGSLSLPNKRFRCPYHGWQYTADGKLAVATSIKGCLGFKPKDNGLINILVDNIGPWIFIRLDKEGSKGSLVADQPDMAQFFQMLEESGYNDLVHVRSKSYVLNCNYKVYMDNYLDGGYHVPVAHPALNSALNFESYKRSGSKNYYLQTCGAASDSPDRVGAGNREALYIFHYPNLCVNRYGDWMDTNIVWPISHDKCRGKDISAPFASIAFY
jgi:choline monooxygenase